METVLSYISLGILAALGLYSLYRPFAGLLALSFMIPIEMVSWVFSETTFTGIKILGITVLIGFLFDMAVHRRRIKFIATFAILSALVLLAWLSTLWAEVPKWSLWSGFVFTEMLVFYLLIVNLSKGAETNFLKAFIFGNIVSITIGLIAFATSYLEGGEIGVTRYGGGVIDPNGFASITATSLPIAMMFLRTEKRSFLKVLFLYAIIGGFFSIIISQSRGGLLATIPFLLYLLYFLFRVKKNAGGALVVILIAAAAAASFIWFYRSVPSYITRIETFQDPTGESAAMARFVQIDVGLKVFEESPLFGVGAGNFRIFIERYTSIEMVSHNTFMSVLVELGIAGLLIFLFFIFRHLKMLTRIALDRARGEFGVIAQSLIVSMSAALVSGLTLSWESKKIFYLIFGCAGAIYYHYKRQKEAS